MKELHKTSFLESLLIQKRVIGALLMREIITRYGRNNIGFLWFVCRTFAADFGYGVDVEIFPHAQRVSFEYRGIHADRLSDDDDVA